MEVELVRHEGPAPSAADVEARLRPGDRLRHPAGTARAAVVGPTGCACVEGKT